MKAKLIKERLNEKPDSDEIYSGQRRNFYTEKFSIAELVEKDPEDISDKIVGILSKLDDKTFEEVFDFLIRRVGHAIRVIPK